LDLTIGTLDEQKWKLQEQVSFLEGQVKELIGTIVKLKAENLQKSKQIDAFALDAETIEEPVGNLQFFNQKDRDSRRSLSLSIEHQSSGLDNLSISPIRQNPPPSPMRIYEYVNDSKVSNSRPDPTKVLFNECNHCAVLEERLDDLTKQKEEVQHLLDRSYEAFERLQNESLLSAGDVSISDSGLQLELDAVKLEYQRACDEKFELEELLTQSREALERLQSESMLSSSDVLAVQVQDLQLKLDETLEEKNRLRAQLESLHILPTTEKDEIPERTAAVANVQNKVADVHSHAIQAKELLEGTRNEILEAQSSITAAISDLVVQYKNAIKTPRSAQGTPLKRTKESRSASGEGLVESYECRHQSQVFRRRPFATPVLGVSPSHSTFSLDEINATPTNPRIILKELQTLQMPSAKRSKSLSSQNNSNSIGALTYTMIGSYVSSSHLVPKV
jgi:chromosome segregation ATPase